MHPHRVEVLHLLHSWSILSSAGERPLFISSMMPPRRMLLTCLALNTLLFHILFFILKINYPFPCISLHILDAISVWCITVHSPHGIHTKLHLNHHTTWSIMHGPLDLWGLVLPQLFTYQGINKLQLLLGHMHLHNNTGTFPCICLFYLQFLMGSDTFY